jgi:DNA-binding transcriptional LysR family regulator
MSMSGIHDLELRHLAALRAVAVEGSFGRAAQRLGFSQAAISQQIAGLERAIGQPVFDRPGGPRRAEITPAGRLLLRHAESILDRIDAAAEELGELAAGISGRLVVGTFQSVSVKLLPSVVGQVRAETPGVDIRLFETDDNDELVRRLAADELDLSFLIGPVTDERIETVELCQDPFVLVLPAETELTAAAYPLADLAGRPMVGQQVSSCQNLIDGGLRASGVSPNYVFRSNDNGAVQAMVRAGMGPAILPLLAVDPDDPGVQIRPLDPPLEPRTILVGQRRGRTRTPAGERFVELALRSCRSPR